MKKPHSESFWLALTIAGLFALLLTVLIIASYRSPFMIFRLPEKAAAHSP